MKVFRLLFDFVRDTRSRHADLAARTDTNAAQLFARINRLEAKHMSKLDDINAKVDQIKAMLDAKTASAVDDSAQLEALDTRLAGILTEHASPLVPGAVSEVVTTVTDPVTGLPTT